MAKSLSTIRSEMCESGIGRMTSPVSLLQAIGQLYDGVELAPPSPPPSPYPLDGLYFGYIAELGATTMEDLGPYGADFVVAGGATITTRLGEAFYDPLSETQSASVLPYSDIRQDGTFMMRIPGDYNLATETSFNRFRPFSLKESFNGLDWYYPSSGVGSGVSIPCNTSGNGLMNRSGAFSAWSNDSSWHVWLVTYTVTDTTTFTCKLWKDGAHVGNYTANIGNFCSSADAFKRFSTSESGWSHCMMWDRILTDAEILNLNEL